MEAIKIDDTGAVLVNVGEFNLWMDIYKDSDGEFYADWNQYIFHLDDPKDVAIKAFQEDCGNFMEASEVAIEYYERNFPIEN